MLHHRKTYRRETEKGSCGKTNRLLETFIQNISNTYKKFLNKGRKKNYRKIITFFLQLDFQPLTPSFITLSMIFDKCSKMANIKEHHK